MDRYIDLGDHQDADYRLSQWAEAVERLRALHAAWMADDGDEID